MRSRSSFADKGRVPFVLSVASVASLLSGLLWVVYTALNAYWAARTGNLFTFCIMVALTAVALVFTLSTWRCEVRV